MSLPVQYIAIKSLGYNCCSEPLILKGIRIRNCYSYRSQICYRRYATLLAKVGRFVLYNCCFTWLDV